MTNKPFKAKLTITQDDLDAKFQELANKKERVGHMTNTRTIPICIFLLLLPTPAPSDLSVGGPPV